MKVAPILRALKSAGHDAILVHTGQHYDVRMSDSFFADLHMPAPDHHLGVGSASHAVQTARIMERFEPVLLQERADWVVVPGDVNSTLACALVTVKLKPVIGTRIAHLEAGLRSHDWRMPEEINRVLTDRCSDLLLTPSRDADENLVAEGIPREKIAFIGNVMIDTLFARVDEARALAFPHSLGLERGNFVLATLHRPSNVDDHTMLDIHLRTLAELAQQIPVVLPMHPRTRQQIREYGLDDALAQVNAMDPLPYSQMLALTEAAALVLTDSGGLQEESTVLGVPCVTLREHTERPITIAQGTNRLAPWPPSVEGTVAAAKHALSLGRIGIGTCCPEGWDGNAASRVVRALTASGTGSP